MPDRESRSVISVFKFIWLNVWFWTVCPVYSALFFLASVVYIWFYDLIVRDPRKTSRLIRGTLNWYGLGVLKCGWPLIRVRFVDYGPEDKPPFVFVSNHPSSSDGFLMAYVWFEAVQMLNIWPNRVPIMRFIARKAGYISVREMPFDQFLVIGSKLLSEGCSVIAFPEGTRSGNKEMGTFHGSAFRLAQQNNVKIVPLVLSGNRKMPPRGSALLHPGRVVVSKLPAITPEQYAGMTSFRLKNFVRDLMQQHLADHRV
jgi:1-acyl-sn-glycerol-3-phosphate acyltransferase